MKYDFIYLSIINSDNYLLPNLHQAFNEHALSIKNLIDTFLMGSIA